MHEDADANGFGGFFLEAPARAAPWACEAMQPSHPYTTPIASAMSSLTFLSNAPEVSAALLISANPR